MMLAKTAEGFLNSPLGVTLVGISGTIIVGVIAALAKRYMKQNDEKHEATIEVIRGVAQTQADSQRAITSLAREVSFMRGFLKVPTRPHQLNED